MLKVETYLPMFNTERFADLLIDSYPKAKMKRDETVQTYTKEFTKVIDWAIKTLRRDDRVVWYLRYFKANELHSICEDGSLFNETERNFMEKYAHLTEEPSNFELKRDFIEINRLQARLEHFFVESEMNEVNVIRFKDQSLEMLLTELLEAEKAYTARIEEQSRWTQVSGTKLFEPKSLKGFAFYDLEKPGCREEGRLMGHCGAMGYRTENRTVISLREHHPTKKGWVKPHVTLTFDIENKMTGEIKGRFNQHPDEQYHEALIEFLLSDHVHLCEGGGYLPENNFSVSNSLDEDRAQEILQIKPSIFTLEEVFEAEGSRLTNTVLDRVIIDPDVKSYAENTFNFHLDEGRAHFEFANMRELAETVSASAIVDWMDQMEDFEFFNPNGDGFYHSDIPIDLLEALSEKHTEQYINIYNYLISVVHENADCYEYEDFFSAQPATVTELPDPQEFLDILKAVEDENEITEGIYRCLLWAYNEAYSLGHQNTCYKLVNEAMTDVGTILNSRFGDEAVYTHEHIDDRITFHIDFKALMADMLEESHMEYITHNVELDEIVDNWFERAIGTELRSTYDFGYSDPDIESATSYLSDILDEIEIPVQPIAPPMPTRTDDDTSLSM